MRKTVAVLVSAVLVLAAAGVVQAATEAQKQTAINNGLTWLAGQQDATGGWTPYNSAYYDTATTAAVLLAFQEHGYHAADLSIYDTTVTKGLNYLFQQAQYSTQVPGGIKFNSPNAYTEDNYNAGIAIPAIVASGTPNAVVTSGPLTGMTYAAVVQGICTYLAGGQNTAGWPTGGWDYTAGPTGRSDNSVSQWPTMGLLYGQSSPWNATVPAGVKTALQTWIAYIQAPSGGSTYTNDGYSWVNPAKTGGLLVEMTYAGVGGTAEQNAINYLNAMWNTYGQEGTFGEPYAMWSIYKGLEVTIGTGNTTQITPRAQGSNLIDPGDTWNWYEDFCAYLVSTQGGGGAWPSAGWTEGMMNTAWDINILLATEIPPPPVIPEPMTMAGVLLGLGCVVRYIRRRG
jgi:hypothetical protein